MKSSLLLSTLMLSISILISGCDATDDRETRLLGSYVYIASDVPDTLEFDFLDSSKMKWRLDGKTPIDMDYTFRDGNLILWRQDSLGKSSIWSAGRVEFVGDDFDQTFAHVYYSDPGALPGPWYSAETKMNPILDSVFVTVFPRGGGDSVVVRQPDGRYAGPSGPLQARYWVDDHRLFVLTPKKWRFEKK